MSTYLQARGIDGNKTERLAAFRQRAGGEFHRQRAHRSAGAGAGARARDGGRGDVRARGAERVAYPSAGAESDRDVRPRPGAELGRAGAGDPPRRRGLVSAEREALARRRADDGDDAHRDSGGARRQGGRVAGEGERRAVRQAALTKGKRMDTKKPAGPAHKAIGDFAPKLAELTDD